MVCDEKRKGCSMIKLDARTGGAQYEEARRLMEIAQEARKFAYTPYSHFAVGAALLCEDDSIITGCNVENAAYSPGNCAERTAIFKAVSEGKRKFSAIAVVGAKEGEVPTGDSVCTPCGVCRQVMGEFCEAKSFRIYVTDGKELFCYALAELLPLAFGPAQL